MLKCMLHMHNNSRVCFLMVALLQLTTDSPDVIWTTLLGGKENSATLVVRNVNSSFLLVASRKKSIQLLGSLVWPCTFLCTPLPLFSRVHSFKLSVLKLRRRSHGSGFTETRVHFYPFRPLVHTQPMKTSTESRCVCIQRL